MQAIALLLSLTACISLTACAPTPTDAPASAPAPPSPSASSRCGPPDIPATALRIRWTGALLDAYELGAGTRGVLLVPERGGLNLCGWWEYAGYLAGQGFRVMVFDHRCTGRSTCPAQPEPNGLVDDITATTAQLRHDGADRIVLIGASQGGSEVIIAGARPPAGVVAVVALSADELTEPLAAAPYPATASAGARRLALPSLFAVAADDRYVSLVETQALVASVPGTAKRLVVAASGRGHGWDLLRTGPDGDRPAPDADILAFLATQLQ